MALARAGALVPVADRHVEHARELASLLRALGLRPEVDRSGETVGKKVRAAQLAKAPYVLVIGDKEIESGELTVRDREGVETKGVPFDDFAAALVDEAASKRLTSRGSAADARTPGDRVERIWSPWRMAYIQAAEQGEDGGCIFCDLPAEGDDDER